MWTREDIVGIVQNFYKWQRGKTKITNTEPALSLNLRWCWGQGGNDFHLSTMGKNIFIHATHAYVTHFTKPNQLFVERQKAKPLKR